MLQAKNAKVILPQEIGDMVVQNDHSLQKEVKSKGTPSLGSPHHTHLTARRGFIWFAIISNVSSPRTSSSSLSSLLAASSWYPRQWNTKSGGWEGMGGDGRDGGAKAGHFHPKFTADPNISTRNTTQQRVEQRLRTVWPKGRVLHKFVQNSKLFLP